MTVNSIKAAWAEVHKIFPTDYELDNRRSQNAGYPIYFSAAEGVNAWISDLGNRLEVNLPNGESVNIWIEEPKAEVKAEGHSQIGNGSSYIVYLSKNHDSVAALHHPMLAMKKIHDSSAGWYWTVSTVEVLNDCRVPAVYHGKGMYATIVEHNNGDWNKLPTYEIIVI